jgi:hypothetical protein
MSDKTTLMRAFNNHLFELLDDILGIYPDDVNISVAKKSLEQLKSANPSIVVKAWYNYVYLRYQTQIESGDLTFFFEKDYREDLVYVSNNDEVLKIIEKVRNPLREMSSANQEHTVSYLKNLNKLAFMYNQL